MIASEAALLESLSWAQATFIKRNQYKDDNVVVQRCGHTVLLRQVRDSVSIVRLMSFQKIEFKLFTLILCFKGLRNYLAKFKQQSKEIF